MFFPRPMEMEVSESFVATFFKLILITHPSHPNGFVRKLCVMCIGSLGVSCHGLVHNRSSPLPPVNRHTLWSAHHLATGGCVKDKQLDMFVRVIHDGRWSSSTLRLSTTRRLKVAPSQFTDFVQTSKVFIWTLLASSAPFNNMRPWPSKHT